MPCLHQQPYYQPLCQPFIGTYPNDLRLPWRWRRLPWQAAIKDIDINLTIMLYVSKDIQPTTVLCRPGCVNLQKQLMPPRHLKQHQLFPHLPAIFVIIIIDT